MTGLDLNQSLATLTDVQRRAVEWDTGALLVLAGPRSGKTQVLACRIARLLDASRDSHFRILGLTFTNKAADEMKVRVRNLVPGLQRRANIATFHGFCAQVLRQHGAHIGIRSDFTIYALEADRRAVLKDALQRAESQGVPASSDDMWYLTLIDRVKSKLVFPDDVTSAMTHFHDVQKVKLVYRLYEEELRPLNALDFSSLLLEAYRLIQTYPAFSRRYLRVYPYWMVDEFQDTSRPQYHFLKAMSGDQFNDIFVVADDDQIILRWNGASYETIVDFVDHFKAEVIQVSSNYRCPPSIIGAANTLVAHNTQRTVGKQRIKPVRIEHATPASRIRVRVFETDKKKRMELRPRLLRWVLDTGAELLFWVECVLSWIDCTML